MSWNPLDNPQDYIVLAGKRSPGLCDITGGHQPRNWDKRKGPGFIGAFSVYHGMDLAEFTVTLRLYTAQDWDDWHAWKHIVDRPPPLRPPQHLVIEHPLLTELGVARVVVTDVTQPHPDESGSGMWSIDIKFLQYRRPKIRLVKPEGGDDGNPPDPVEVKIGGLVNQFNELAKGP